MSSNNEVYKSYLTPLSFIERSADVYADKTAIIHGATRYTYGQFGERVNRLASALKARGLKKGDRVAFLCPNIPPMLDAHFGVLLAGGVLHLGLRVQGEGDQLCTACDKAFLGFRASRRRLGDIRAENVRAAGKRWRELMLERELALRNGRQAQTDV